ncbi:hypothetical protein AcW1_004248 [Taiwanofungus camphoratus]|nr:hypothetical protein AcW2_006741 [Antrodia cinnamomea]KAI0939129.1 hypothetical protein AcV5_000629 [Antrodia cinnamomea]KAI0952048.1 hypothetical protein AcV7_007971 [Antrodia cinnamomea]KAI0959425.1 hypothetical protein AcW1_004248 [Antrodia cinnamomea]
MAETNQERLLRILEARGQQFLGSFASPVTIGKRKSRGVAEEQRHSRKRKVQEQYEEWSGFNDHSDQEGDKLTHEVSDGKPLSHHGSSQHTNVFVFSDTQPGAGSSSIRPKKAQMKAFMSSKVTKLTQEIQDSSSEEPSSDKEDELTNAQNDALLHRLVHTHLLSGSTNPDLDMSSAQRKKDLAGRVLEVAGKAKLGKGEGTVRTLEQKRAAKRVREGIALKQKERNQRELEEAKHLGNYHPTLKRLYGTSSEAHFSKRRREKGLKMGVGSFRGGILKLSKDDIDSANGRTRGAAQRFHKQRHKK